MSLQEVALQILHGLYEPAILIDPRGRAVDFNRACVALTKRRPRALRRELDAARNVFDVIGGSTTQKLFRALLDKCTPIHLQGISVQAADERLEEAALSLVPMLNGTAEVGFVLFSIRDTSAEARTQRRFKSMLQQERRRADELERRVQERTKELEASRAAAERMALAKGDFLATMSHELRTPMNGICGMLSLLLDRTDLAQDVQDELGVVENSARAMVMLLNDALDASKIESGRLDLERVAFDVHDLVGAVGSMIDALATSASLECRVQLAPDVPRWVYGDPTRLRQVLANLAGNAVKFTREGHVTIEARTVEVGGERRIRFAVRDTGIGIPLDHQPRIFEAYMQADSSTTREFGGTGLGLSISRRLVELMESHIELESEVGVGTEFSFELMLDEAEAPEPVHEIATTGRCIDGMSVLLVEDNVVNQMVATRMLERMGCTVDVAPNGVKGVEAAARVRYDAILMDCQMPELDGFQAARRIRAAEPSDRVPIVALTANVLGGVEEACYDAGMDAYLSKPLDRAALRATLERFSVDAEGVTP